MSHEVRTPLTAIVGFAESVLYHGLSENEQKKALHTVLKNSSHMLELINDILDFSKIEAGKLDVEIIDCSVLEILSDVQALMQQKAASKGLKLEMHYRCPIPEVIQSDPTRFKQILINLVSNAVKFTESGSVHLNVSCDTRRETLLIEVVDTGIGLTEEQRDKLFEAYIQADPSTARQFGGTGLGLNVSKKLAAALGGSIAVASAAGQGSTFSLELSTGSLERVRMIDEPDIRQWSMEETFSASENSLQRPYGVPQLEGRVLLAEDVKDNQDLISMLIAKTGAGVKVAENGLLALEAAKQESFDLILMDMQMPVMGGCAAIANIRQSGYSGSIVSLTADNACVKKRTCVGCTNYLRKPFSHEEFYTMLSANLPVSGQVQLDGQRAADAPMFSSMIEDDPDYAPIILRFVDRLPVRIDKLDTAYKEGDWDELKAEAHKLASGELFGYPELTKVARELELAAAEQLSEQAASAIGAVSNLSSAIIAGRESLVRSISA